MEPPAKELRILQSVEVDETDANYIAAKQKQQQKLKGTLESIFEKYEAMHESMSDEVSMRTGRVVVDRGHIRREERKWRRASPQSIESMLEGLSGYSEEQPESEDELAPTQGRKRTRDSMEDQSHGVLPFKQRSVEAATSPSSTITAKLVQMNAQQIPNTSSQVADILQHVPFPQTSLGKQTQAALSAALNNAIVRAVQETLVPLLSSFSQTKPCPQVAYVPVCPLPATYQPATDKIKPPTDPKWYFPPVACTERMQRIGCMRSSLRPMAKVLQETGDRDGALSRLVSRPRSPKVHSGETLAASRTNDNNTILPSDEFPPSIEGTDFRTENELDLDPLKTEESEEEEPATIKAISNVVPSQRHKQHREQQPRPDPVRTHHNTSSSSDDLDFIGADDVPTDLGGFAKRGCASQYLCSPLVFKSSRPVPVSSELTSPVKSSMRLADGAVLKKVKQSRTEKKTRGQKRMCRVSKPKVLQTTRINKLAELDDSEDELAW